MVFQSVVCLRRSLIFAAHVWPLQTGFRRADYNLHLKHLEVRANFLLHENPSGVDCFSKPYQMMVPLLSWPARKMKKKIWTVKLTRKGVLCLNSSQDPNEGECE